jgi:hypothetical protein
MCVQLSWDGGTSWTAASTTYQTATLSTSQRTYSLGENGDTWGRTWALSELSDANFRVRVTDVASSTSRTFYLDWAAVRVYYGPPGSGPCDYAARRAAAAKALDPPIEVFTIGYGLSSTDSCTDSTGPWRNRLATELLADMATDSQDEWGHCVGSTAIRNENADGDHFLCEARGTDLEPVFRAAAEALASGSRLVSLPY